MAFKSSNLEMGMPSKELLTEDFFPASSEPGGGGVTATLVRVKYPILPHTCQEAPETASEAILTLFVDFDGETH